MRFFVVLFCALAFPLVAQEARLSPNAPKDATTAGVGLQKIDAAIAPYVAQARATYPGAKARFLAGLPKGQIFFVTARLRDDDSHVEQVFIRVAEIKNGLIQGRIASQIDLVKGYRSGDLYSFPETQLLDWLIARPDGSEEGNVVGKFLETHHGDGT
jgi:hypothetical protein